MYTIGTMYLAAEYDFKSVNSSDKKFYHYTQMKNVENICIGNNKTRYWFASNIMSMNDNDETKLHDADKERVYVISFSNSEAKKENIPMWFLYGGVTGRGARIGLTKNAMNILINGIQCAYQISESCEINTKKEYKLGIDFDLYYAWVNYSKNPFKEKNEKNKYAIKGIDWKYEKEFRIILVFKESIGKRVAIKINDKVFSNSIKGGVHVGLGPEEDTKINIIEKATLWNLHKAKIRPCNISTNMQILKRNVDSIIDNLEDIFSAMSAVQKESFEEKYKELVE